MACGIFHRAEDRLAELKDINVVDEAIEDLF
jgi:hypothetical protein